MPGHLSSSPSHNTSARHTGGAQPTSGAAHKAGDAPFELIGVGSPIMDLLAHCDDAFLRAHVAGEKGGMLLVEDADIAALVARLASSAPLASVPGGAAANTTVAAAQLGLRSSFLGKVGGDATASDYLSHFRAQGSDSSRFKRAALPNARCLSLVTPDGQRTMRTHLGAAMTLAPEEISAADFAQCRHAHIEGYLLFNRELADKVVASARAAGCTLSIDLASFEVVAAARDWLFAQLEQGVDIIFANEDEARALFERDEPYENYARSIADYGGVAAVKMGAAGAWLAQGEALHRIAAVPVAQVVDTTGAGDAWAGGFLYAHLRGAPLAVAGELGAHLGAQAVQHLGAAIAAERWEPLRRRAAQLLNANAAA